jgi:polysaccharide chain length determinant protein (PEP-CTERM system associated)
MTQGSKSIGEYVSALKAHWVQILYVAAPLAALALLVAHSLPPIYRAQATIRVQEQDIPPELVKSTISSVADERMQLISQQVMTRASLLDLAHRHGLYRDQREHMSDDEIVDDMRKSIKLQTITASIVDRGSLWRRTIVTGFTISYESPSPTEAKTVVDEVVKLYLNENAKVRQEGVAKATAFLTNESERIARQIQEIETSIATFKQNHADRMPDTGPATAQLIERNQVEIARIERELGVAQDRKMSLESQLALVDPRMPPPVSGPAGERMMSPEQKLRALEAQYATQLAMYQEEHPDVRRTKREIEALKAEMGTSSGAAEDSANQKAGTPAKTVRPDNPAYLLLVSQIEGLKREIVQLSATRDDLRAKQRTYETRLLAMPEIEREYRDLIRDYDNAQSRYREIKTKLTQAESARELEKDSKAERFTLGEPASVSGTPVRPNRERVAAMGLAGSVGAGVGVAFVRDAFSGAIKTPAELARIARLPVLTPIPYIQTRRERSGRLGKTLAMLVLLTLLVAATVFSIREIFEAKPQILDVISRLPIWR